MKKIKEHFHLKEIEPNVFLLEFEDRADLAYTFMRPQEYYENPIWRGKIFTTKQFESWYKKYKNQGTMTYHTDWNGFNIPSYILEPFYNGKFKSITKREKVLLDMFSDKSGKFYVIGCRKGSRGVLHHEITHARYYLNERYRIETLACIKRHNVQELYQALCESMYGYKTWDDEINAYMVTGWGFLKAKVKDPKEYESLRKELIEINKKYFN